MKTPPHFATTAAIVVALVLALLTRIVSASAAVTPQTPANTLSRSAPIAYGTCPARTVILTVTVPTRPFDAGELIQYLVSLRYRSGRTCGPSHGPHQVSGSVAELLGPCGPLDVAILDARGAEVYPGPEAISCPAILGPQLRGHQMLTAEGNWDQIPGGGRPARVAHQVPPGTYRLVIANKVSVPLVLSGP